MPEWKSFTFGEDGEATPTAEAPTPASANPAMEPVSVIAEVTLGRYVEALSRRSADAISSACDGSKKRG